MYSPGETGKGGKGAMTYSGSLQVITIYNILFLQHILILQHFRKILAPKDRAMSPLCTFFPRPEAISSEQVILAALRSCHTGSDRGRQTWMGL